MGKDFKNYKDESRKNWGTKEVDKQLTLEQVNTGAILRIADSLERIEQPYLQLINENQYFKRKCDRLQDEVERLRFSNRGLKGAYTKLKNSFKNNG